jgi:DsbC/DsbD-like thiol-disulfide interchange protein
MTTRARFALITVAVASAPWLAPPASARQTAAEASQVVQWTLDVSRAAAGDSVTAELRAAPRRGWRVYGQRQPAGGPTPLTITVVTPGVRLDGEIAADPEPEEKYDAVWSARVRLHTKATVFRVPLRVSDVRGPGALRMRVRWQACSDEICLRPVQTIVSADL